MLSGSPAILVDTNVLVYAHDPRNRAKQDKAVAVLDLLFTQGRVALSVQCLNEFLNVVRTLPEPMPLTEACVDWPASHWSWA